MVSGFDRIVIAVPDIAAATLEYESLLGVVSQSHSADKREPTVWLGLPNVTIELVQDAVDAPAIRSLVFTSPTMNASVEQVDNPLQLDIKLCDGQATSDVRRRAGPQGAGLRVDHLVLRTDDAQACIALFADQLGIRLALDKTVPEWGGRMLFFRTGQLTLEVIESDRDAAGGNYFWGIAYQCQDIVEMGGVLEQRGVTLSDIRTGRKPGTRVATLKSHCLGIPTLLIEPST